MTILGISFAFHLVGINLWVGADFLVALAIIPALRTLGVDEQTKFLKAFTGRYLPVFILGGLAVGVTGWFQTFHMLSDLNLPVAYAKHAMIVLLILVSGYLWFFLARWLSGPLAGREKVWNRFVALVWIQAGLGLIVLILTGWLTQ